MTWVSKRLTLCWLVLVLVSVLSFESSLFGSKAAGAIVITIGLLKAWIVGREFMEIRCAPLIMRAIFAAWLLGLGAVLLSVFYLLGT
ncbi:MAG: hypothetical protein C0409_14450 [Novosphingobium sp.]|nr:hypothetical protein [Novosphingobium sp.]